MNRFHFFLVAAFIFLLSSCRSTYSYVQIFDIEAIKQNGETNLKQTDGDLFYEDDDCALDYFFWDEAGTMTFAFTNKSDSIMYIDMTKSFVIKNGLATDYYTGMEWSDMYTQSTSAGLNYAATASYSVANVYNDKYWIFPGATGANKSIESGTIAATSGSSVVNQSSSGFTITYKEPTIIAVPPKASKIISSVSIRDDIFRDCDLERYPAEVASLTYSQENSPLIFSNFITYRKGENAAVKSIENHFYISAITNYASPSIFDFEERENICPNLTNLPPSKRKIISSTKVYDRYVTIDTSNRFYLQYEVRSKYKLYKWDRKFYYSPAYNGYVTNY